MCSFYTLFVIVFSFAIGTVYMYVWYLYEQRSINQINQAIKLFHINDLQTLNNPGP